MPFLSLITGPIGKILGVLALAGVVTLAAHNALHMVANYYAAQATMRAQAAQLVQIQADHQREIAALKLQSDADLARAQLASKTRSAINAAPRTTACASSPAIRALLDSLQPAPAPGGHDPGAANPGTVAGVSAATGAARYRHGR